MDWLAPLLHAPPVTIVHAICALAGFVLGLLLTTFWTRVGG